MTAITWVLAADEKRARVFETHGLKLDLRQIEDIRNTADIGNKDREKFAEAIAAFLEQSRVRHRFDRLRLAVEPAFLDVLREQLSTETRKLVHEDSNNDARGSQRRIEPS